MPAHGEGYRVALGAIWFTLDVGCYITGVILLYTRRNYQYVLCRVACEHGPNSLMFLGVGHEKQQQTKKKKTVRSKI